MQYFSFKKSFDENKATYRQLVKIHHPDKGGKQSVFVELNKQWEFYQFNHKKANTADKKQAFDTFASKVNYTEMKDDLEQFYNSNKQVIDELLNEIILNKRKKQVDTDVLQFGFKLGKSIFNIFK